MVGITREQADAILDMVICEARPPKPLVFDDAKTLTHSTPLELPSSTDSPIEDDGFVAISQQLSISSCTQEEATDAIMQAVEEATKAERERLLSEEAVERACVRWHGGQEVWDTVVERDKGGHRAIMRMAITYAIDDTAPVRTD